MDLIKMIVIPLVVSLVVSLVVFFMLGSNKQPNQAQQEEATVAAAPVQIKAIVIAQGKYQTFMLKGGRDVAVVDSLTLLVGSETCRAAVAEKAMR